MARKAKSGRVKADAPAAEASQPAVAEAKKSAIVRPKPGPKKTLAELNAEARAIDRGLREQEDEMVRRMSDAAAQAVRGAKPLRPPKTR